MGGDSWLLYTTPRAAFSDAKEAAFDCYLVIKGGFYCMVMECMGLCIASVGLSVH